MKTRSTHFGGWRWRMRVFPWGVLGSWIGMAAAVVVITIALVLFFTWDAS